MGPVNNLRLTPILCASAGTAAGFYVLFRAPESVIITVLVLSVAALSFFRVLSLLEPYDALSAHSRNLQLTALCSLVFAAGLCVGVSSANAGRGEINFGMPEKNVTAVEGVLLEDPRIISSGSAMVTLSLKRCAAGGVRVSGSGELLVFFQPLNAKAVRQFGRGATVFAEGSLRSGDRGLSFSAKSLHIVKPAPALERMRTNIRLSLISRFDSGASGESSRGRWGGLSLALLLGIRDNLDSEFSAVYSRAGLSYILSLSGMHLAILTALIAFLLKKPLGLKTSVIVSAVIIILYCLLVGPSPSLIRAAIMYLLGVIAVLGALPKKAMAVLALSFLLQIIFTPAAGNSLSFILSYLALLGIFIIGNSLSSLFAGKVPNFILQPVSASCGAFLATAGICTLVFGTLEPVGIASGLLIVPLTTVFMTGSVIWLLLDMFSLSAFFGYPLSWLYGLMESIASAAGKAPGISVNTVLIIVLSIVISILIIVLDRRSRAVLLKLDPFL